MAVLRTEGLTKQFGGLTAVDDVDFELAGGELCSLIGPNGAGKTTFFDLLTGALDPTAGTVEVAVREDTDGERADGGSATGGSVGWIDITDAPPHATAQQGLHRSYQVTNVFPTSTVLENVRIAAQAHGDDSFRAWRNVNGFESYLAEARQVLERVGLGGKADAPAETLSHGEKRQLEVGIALAGDPEVLLLDEPNAGVSSESVDDIIALIEDVATDHAVLLVEHNMDIVMNVSDRIVVLNRGEVIADGPPDAVRDDPAVQEAYLGGYEPGDVGDDTDAEDPGDATEEGDAATDDPAGGGEPG
ncbi:ABC transporter ATP-binding protein [Haloglomus irregulare]|jgi:branched-chain amino acid transport system ATP-binding protein|uniref:ABC transporter ATP-binding protein n=1 Tax=Haloglomus irregulare TaxID=2234134 RepID=A0A554N928_9EURY|nr:ABC transporter ATP-binding protein [Haloglomus irregulare]TSD13917.1 ABC transporter ATP-binding protein [Haloglomus irregulare]